MRTKRARFKRVLSLLAAVAITATMLPAFSVTAFADSGSGWNPSGDTLPDATIGQEYTVTIHYPAGKTAADYTSKSPIWLKRGAAQSGAQGETVYQYKGTPTKEGPATIEFTLHNDRTQVVKTYTIEVKKAADPAPDPAPAPSTGGSSGGSSNGPVAAPATKPVNASAAGKTAASNNSQTFRNYDLLTPDGVKAIAGKSTEVNFDKTVGNKVLSRITMNPADLAKAVTKNVKLGVHFDAKNREVSAVASKLGNYFSNEMVLVTYDQKSVLPVNAEFAAKLDLSGLNTETLYVYSYDSTTNKYAQISAPNYFVDANGYVHFTAPFGGTVIITDAPLAK